jgi:hypothetical protein
MKLTIYKYIPKDIVNNNILPYLDYFTIIDKLIIDEEILYKIFYSRRSEDGVEGIFHSEFDIPYYSLITHTFFWYKKGLLHRDNGPASITYNCDNNDCNYTYIQHYKNGELHRDNGPADITIYYENKYGQKYVNYSDKNVFIKKINKWYHHNRNYRKNGKHNVEIILEKSGVFYDKQLLWLDDIGYLHSPYPTYALITEKGYKCRYYHGKPYNNICGLFKILFEEFFVKIGVISDHYI